MIYNMISTPAILSDMLEDDRGGLKKSHLTAEKRRRESIRRNFDVLTAAIPGLEARHARSEAVVIGKCVEFLQQLYEEHRQLQELADKHNIDTSA